MNIRTTILLASLLLMTALSAQNPRSLPKAASPRAMQVDPFAVTATPAAGAADPGGESKQNLSVRYEVFSLDLAVAADLQRSDPGDLALYQQMISMVAKKEARQETMTMVRCWPRNRAMTESIAAKMFPMEFEPPELPNTVGVSISPPVSRGENAAPQDIPDAGKLEKAPVLSQFNGIQTPATPTSFETHKFGTSLEVEATLVPSTGMIELRLASGDTTFAGMTTSGQGLSKVEMPEVEIQNIANAVTVAPGKAFLLGTVNRPPVSKVDADSAARIWFAFVTVGPVKP